MPNGYLNFVELLECIQPRSQCRSETNPRRFGRFIQLTPIGPLLFPLAPGSTSFYFFFRPFTRPLLP